MVDKENAPASARVTAAKAVFDIAGVGRDVGRDVKGDLSDDLRSKPLHERTTEELQEVVDKARITLANTPRLIAPTPDDEIH
jgi:hypothetical protein